MRSALFPLLLLGASPLGGCAYLPFAPMVAEVVNSAAQGGGYANPDFRAAATEACTARASRHGRATITNIQDQGSTSIRVTGSIQSGYTARSFGCTFSTSGHVTDFDLGR